MNETGAVRGGIMTSYREIITELFGRRDFPEDAFYLDRRLAGKELIVYGAGEGFHWIEEILMRIYGCRPTIVLDQVFRPGDTFKGIAASSPYNFKPSPEQQRNALVVIAVGKQQYHREIFTCLRDMGFEDVVCLMDVYEIHNPLRLPDALNTEGFAYFLSQKEPILRAFGLMQDELSREIFSKFLQTHMLRKPVLLPASPREEQFFPTDIGLSKGHGRFVNCGAYDGDTIKWLNLMKGRVAHIACFEAEPFLFQQLVNYLWKYKNELVSETITALPCAVYDREALLPFKSGGGLGSRVAEDGDVMVQTVSLDHAIPGFRPTFICMDLEGAEPQALAGAKHLLRECRPDLGICVYHAPNHLWELPLYLHDLGLGYKFYLRNYTTFSSETVLYATV